MAKAKSDQLVLCQIANCAFQVVSSLLDRDQRLAKSLRSDTSSSRQVVREETITQEMATTLKDTFPQNVDVILFTPNEESRNGADWYWRIQNKNRAIHARVQAKRVQRSEFNQPDSEGTVEFDQEQLSLLLETTERDRKSLPGLQPWIATFGRYDATPPCATDPRNCGNHGCGGNCTQNLIPSIWISQADMIAANGMDWLPMRNVIEVSLRLDCILSCINSVGPGSPGAKGFQLTTGIPSFQDCVEVIRGLSAASQSYEGALLIQV